MRKLALRPDSRSIKILMETGLFRLLNKETQAEIIQNMINDHHQRVAGIIEDSGC